jgi:uncharacterized membrane protein
MRWLVGMTDRLDVAGELIGFFWQRRLYWMIPIVLVLLGFGLLMVAAQGTALSPFIYALF